MSIHHHLTEPLLMSYASGHLPEAFALVAATHISLCDDCRARLGAFEALGGALLEQAPVVPMAGIDLDAIMGRKLSPVKQARKGPLPAPLHDYVGDSLDTVKWRSLGMGAKQAMLPTGPRAKARLLYIPAGQKMPEHSHRGMEMTLVLQGAYRDEDGVFATGDVEVADQATRHRPVAEAGADCICLTATDAPLLFHALLPRIAQRFLGI